MTNFPGTQMLKTVLKRPLLACDLDLPETGLLHPTSAPVTAVKWPFSNSKLCKNIIIRPITQFWNYICSRIYRMDRAQPTGPCREVGYALAIESKCLSALVQIPQVLNFVLSVCHVSVVWAQLRWFIFYRLFETVFRTVHQINLPKETWPKEGNLVLMENRALNSKQMAAAFCMEQRRSG